MEREVGGSPEGLWLDTVPPSLLKRKGCRALYPFEELDKTWVQKQVDTGKSMADITREIGCSYRGLYSFIRTHGIRFVPHKRGRFPLDPKYHTIRGVPVISVLEEYETTRTTITDLAKRFGVTPSYVHQELKALNAHKPRLHELLERGTPPEEIITKWGYCAKNMEKNILKFGLRQPKVRRPKYPELVSKDWMREQFYVKHMSVEDIANLLRCSVSTVCDWMRAHGIKGRALGNFQKHRPRLPLLRDDDWLCRQIV